MTTFLNLVATEPEAARLPIMVDSSRFGPRGGAQVPAGQGHRQLDLAEGRPRGVSRAGADDPPLRRGRRRHGLRRAGPGGDRRAQGRDPRAGVRPPHRRGGLRAGGHRPRPERARGRDRHRGARGLREGLHRGDPAARGALSRRARLGRDLEPLVRLPRERRRPRGDARVVPLPRDPRGARPGDRQRGPARRLRGHRARAPRARRGRPLRPPPGRDRAARRVRTGRDGWGDAAGARPLVARGSVEERLAHALVHGVVDFIEKDTEEARQAAARPLDVIEGPSWTG